MKGKSDFGKNKEKKTLTSVIMKKRTDTQTMIRTRKVDIGYLKLHKRNSIYNFTPYI